MIFKTYAAFDIETSGFACPKITEIAIVACERSHIIEGHGLPRVLHKLTICINPKSKIHPCVTNLTGLDNEDLMNLSSFNDTVVDMLDSFLSRLPQPVCLVAHNGLKFDFPIFKKEIMSCGEVNVENIFCADSLDAFREMLPKQNPVVKELSSPADDMICIKAAEDVEEMLTTREKNEVTPARQIEPLLRAPRKPPNTGPPRLVDSSVRRTLNFSQCGYSEDDPGPEESSQTPRTVLLPLKIHFNCRGNPKSYSLGDIYEYLHGVRFPDAHRAESDAVALLECMVKASAIFDWIDTNAISLSKLTPR